VPELLYVLAGGAGCYLLTGFIWVVRITRIVEKWRADLTRAVSHPELRRRLWDAMTQYDGRSKWWLVWMVVAWPRSVRAVLRAVRGG
jgi:hypothetical protein